MKMISGTAQEFKRKFETPILRGRDSMATDAEHTRGQEKLQEVGTHLELPRNTLVVELKTRFKGQASHIKFRFSLPWFLLAIF